MHNVDYYIALPYKMVVLRDSDEGGYVVSFPELPGCITCADTLEDILKNAEDAKRAWFEAAIESNIEITIPKLTNN